MPVIKEDVHINRPPQDVFDYLNTVENFPVWDSSIIEAEQLTTGPMRTGTRWRGVTKILGRRFEWTSEVTGPEPPVRLTSQAVEGKLNFAVNYHLVAEDGGTRFTYQVEAESGLGGIFGRLTDPLVEKAQRRTVRGNLDTLAELLTQPTS